MTLECSVCEYVVVRVALHHRLLSAASRPPSPAVVLTIICQVWVELHIVARKPDITKQEVLSVLHEVCNSTVLGKYVPPHPLTNSSTVCVPVLCVCWDHIRGMGC